MIPYLRFSIKVPFKLIYNVANKNLNCMIFFKWNENAIIGTNNYFPIPISLQPDGLNFWYFKLWHLNMRKVTNFVFYRDYVCEDKVWRTKKFLVDYRIQVVDESTQRLESIPGISRHVGSRFLLIVILKHSRRTHLSSSSILGGRTYHPRAF